MASGKVWTIEAQRTGRRRKTGPVAPPRSIPEASAGPRNDPRRPSVWKAYLMGPVAPVWMTSGPMAVVWGLLGPGALLAAFALLLLRGRVAPWLQSTTHGDAIGLGIVAFLLLGIFTTWSRAIAAADREPLVTAARERHWLRDARVVVAAGLLVPGLGMMLAGRRRRAGAAFLLLGPVLAGAFVLLRAPQLVRNAQLGASSALGMVPLELTILTAGAAVLAAGLAWIVQALEAPRFLREQPRPSRSAPLALGLIVALIAFAVTFRPQSLAECVHTQAVALRVDGFRVMPWLLNESATRLDPASASYRADAASTAEQLGLAEIGRGHRDEVERRAAEWEHARRDLSRSTLLASTSSSWSRVEELYR